MPSHIRLISFVSCLGLLLLPSFSYGQTQNSSGSTVPTIAGQTGIGNVQGDPTIFSGQRVPETKVQSPTLNPSMGTTSTDPTLPQSRDPLSKQQETPKTDPLSPPILPDPPTPLQLAAAKSFGAMPPIFGQRFFRTPKGYVPNLDAQVPDDYLLAPGDEILVRIWGSVSLNQRVTVDRAGTIYLPQIGNITVAGVSFKNLENTVRAAIDRVYRNYNLSVELGHLRSVQVFVTGAARQPGSYMVSSFSTLINALFVSGGPSIEGSFRRVQLRRGGETITELDLYRFVRFGDKSKDVRLMAGDVIFIPPVGEQVAIGGGVKESAVYELMGGESVAAVINLAGGKANTAAEAPLTIERIVPGDNRTIIRIADKDQPTTPVRNGDIIFLRDLPPSFANSVTLRGNVLQPGRFSWKPGLKLSDILPEKAALLTEDYWKNHNRLSTDPDFEPMISARRTVNSTESGIVSGDSANNLLSQSTTQLSGRDQVSMGAAKAVTVTIPAPDIDWNYAVIERMDPVTLKSTLVPFNLGKLVLDHDASQDKELLPGDVVTIFSQADIIVPREQQTKFVRVEGEVNMAGVYAVKNNETWNDILKKAGGLTSNAYLFGAQFTRESARIAQQQRLDSYVERLTSEVQHSVINVAVNGGSSSAAVASSLPVLEAELLRRIRNQKATGRVVLDTTPDSTSLTELGALTPEDGDVLLIPPHPSTVSVIGAVNNQSSYIFLEGAKAKYYISLAGGPNRAGDADHTFVIRANGSIVSADQSRRFKTLRLAPGDTVVIPEKAFNINKFRMIFDSSLASQFAVVAAIISVIR